MAHRKITFEISNGNPISLQIPIIDKKRVLLTTFIDSRIESAKSRIRNVRAKFTDCQRPEGQRFTQLLNKYIGI